MIIPHNTTPFIGLPVHCHYPVFIPITLASCVRAPLGKLMQLKPPTLRRPWSSNLAHRSLDCITATKGVELKNGNRCDPCGFTRGETLFEAPSLVDSSRLRAAVLATPCAV